jgi:protein-S-isoprenylcysteine O-methyltransferase Ste14
MNTEATYRLAFFVLFVLLLAMRTYFMIKVRRSGGRILPDEGAVQREGGRGVLLIRTIGFFALMIFLVMYFLGVDWIDRFSFPLPSWWRWAGFVIGLVAVAFWTWVQAVLDIQWSAQLQLTPRHHLITTGPYARIRHPLYAGLFGWCLALTLLTANWIFTVVCVLVFLGLLWRIPREEQMMIEAFGEEYRDYMKHTGKLFPKLLH